MDGPGHIPCSVMVGSGTCLHPTGVGGSQFTMTQVIHLPGAIQKGNTYSATVKNE